MNRRKLDRIPAACLLALGSFMLFRFVNLRGLNEEKKQTWRVTSIWLGFICLNIIFRTLVRILCLKKKSDFWTKCDHKIFVTLSTADTQQLFRDCWHVFPAGLRFLSYFLVNFLLCRNALELHRVFWTLLFATLIIFSWSCSDCPVTRALNGASNALASSLHDTAKLPSSGWYEKFTASQLLLICHHWHRVRQKGKWRQSWLGVVDSAWKSLDLLSFFTDSAPSLVLPTSAPNIPN